MIVAVVWLWGIRNIMILMCTSMGGPKHIQLTHHHILPQSCCTLHSSCTSVWTVCTQSAALHMEIHVSLMTRESGGEVTIVRTAQWSGCADAAPGTGHWGLGGGQNNKAATGTAQLDRMLARTKMELKIKRAYL